MNSERHCVHGGGAGDGEEGLGLAARADFRVFATETGRDEIVEEMIVGTVLGDAMASAMRRIARIELSGRRFEGADAHQGDSASD